MRKKMLLKVRIALLTAPLLALYSGARATDIFVFQDLGETVSLELNGKPVTGNGGPITKFTKSGESISFDVAGNAHEVFSGFTNLLDPGPEDAKGTVSDRFVLELGIPDDFHTFSVSFGSDPNLPAIPSGAEDLTTVPIQKLPANPYFENGKQELVGTVFRDAGEKADQFFIASDINGVPEASTWTMLLIGFAGLGYAVCRSSKTRVA